MSFKLDSPFALSDDVTRDDSDSSIDSVSILECFDFHHVICNLMRMAPRDKYSDPKLRDEVKEEIHQGDKGGKPGQWSARKVFPFPIFHRQ
jgi:hypothetical protein